MSVSGKKRALYVARNVATLNDMVDQAVPSSANPRILANSSQRLFSEGEKCFLDGDEEKAYVVYMRFLSLLNKLKQSAEYKKDKKYYDGILGNKTMIIALEKAEKLADSLKTRYEELEAVEVSKKLNSVKETSKTEENLSSSVEYINSTPEERSKNDRASSPPVTLLQDNAKKFLDPSAPAGGITVQAAYRLMQDSNFSVLLMDVRSREDYSSSHISYMDCISVPSDCLKPGVTVSQIEKYLPIESKVAWGGRSTVDYIVLLDWKCSAKELDSRCRISCVKDALFKWDVETELRNAPLILEGGYEEWLLCYPANTTNSNVTAPVSADGLSTAPSLDTIDYDVNLDFLVDTSSSKIPNNSETEVKESISRKSACSIFDGLKADFDTLPSSETLQPKVSSGIPSIDRSNKPQSQSTKMNNAVDKHSAAVTSNGNINRLRNQLNDSSAHNETVEKVPPSVDNITRASTSAGPVPSLDRSKKPTKVSNQDIANQAVRAEADKLQKELHEISLLQEKKALEAQDLAKLMRKKKKMEQELALLTHRRGTEFKEPPVDNVDDGSSSEDERIAKHLAANNPHAHYAQAKSKSTGLANDLRPEEIILEKKLLEEQRRKLDEQNTYDEAARKQADFAEKQKLEEEKRRLEVQKQENLKLETDRKKLEAAEKAKREAERKRLEIQTAEKMKRDAEAAEQQRKNMEEKRKELEEAERIKRESENKLTEEKERRRMAAEKEAVESERQKREVQLAEETKRLQKKNEEERNKKNASKLQNDTAASLPVNWERRYDDKNAKYYYINHLTKKTQWDPPQSGHPTGSSYKTPLKTDASPQTSFGGGLSRSHSSPNIAKLVQDSGSAQAPSTGLPRMQPMPDRSTKPQLSQRIAIQTEVSAAKVRNLQPTWGSVGRGLTGLRNLGNTCYMNSTIQCLSNAVPLTIYFLSNVYIEDINRENSDGYGGQVADEYAVLIKALWSGQYRSVAPKDFRGVSCLMNSMFASSQHQDSQELLMYLMSGLSEGLNKVKRKPSLPALETDNMDDEEASKQVWNYLRLKEDSIFVDLFQGLYKSTVMCQTCDKKSVKFDSFMYLTLPIPSPTRCSLSDCLIHFSKESKLTGDSRWDCPRCRCKRDAVVRLVIWRLPPILLIVLKRFHYEGIWKEKITTHVDFPVEGLEMGRYISGPRTRPSYNLFAVSNHYGMLDGGHYTATCRSPVDSKWYKYDDQEVSEMSPSGIKSSAAYMLFYTSMKFDSLRV